MRSPLENTDQPDYALDDFDTADLDARIKDAVPATDNPGETVDVPLDKIVLTEINSSADFSNPEQYAGMRREADMLSQMQLAVDQGADVETFHDWDKTNQIGHYSPYEYVRGYADVYHTYYDGNELIALEPKSDDTYDVINGRHRIYVCREAGLKTVPAKII